MIALALALMSKHLFDSIDILIGILDPWMDHIILTKRRKKVLTMKVQNAFFNTKKLKSIFFRLKSVGIKIVPCSYGKPQKSSFLYGRAIKKRGGDGAGAGH